MARIPCIITKQFGQYQVGDQHEFDEADIPRLKRRGRIRLPKEAHSVRPNTFLPNPGEAKRTNMNFIDRRTNRGAPTVTVDGKTIKEEGPGEAGDPGPTRDRSERPPAAKPVGPDLNPAAGPDKKKAEVLKANAFWYHVLVDGKPITKGDGKPKNFRKDDAEARADEINGNR